MSLNDSFSSPKYVEIEADIMANILPDKVEGIDEDGSFDSLEKQESSNARCRDSSLQVSRNLTTKKHRREKSAGNQSKLFLAINT